MILWENKKELKELIRSVCTSQFSDFYKKKFINLKEKSEVSLESIPFLTRKELVEILPNDRLYVQGKDVVFVAVTSGTTGSKPLISYFSFVDNAFFEPTLGISIERPLIVYPPLNKNFGYTFVRGCRHAKDKTTPVFGDYQNLTNSAFLAKETNIDSMYATPTIAMKLGEILPKFYDPQKIRLVIVSSETLTLTQRKELTKLYPRAFIANLYASSEIGNFILYPCKHIMESGVDEFHFLSNALTALELVEGELVITYSLNSAFPLIRYKTGDFFEVAHEHCSCGLPGKTLRWSGRMGVDKIRVHGVEVTIGSVEEVFSQLSSLIKEDYQVHFYNDSTHVDGVKIVVEIKRSRQSDIQEAGIALSIKNKLLKNWYITHNMTLSQAIDKNIFSLLEVIFVDNLTLSSEKSRHIVSHI